MDNFKSLSNVAQGIASFWSKETIIQSMQSLSENATLNLASDINAIFADTNLADNKPELMLPVLFVIGTQSSGKSSVLNAIIGMTILPTGEDMVTRVPLEIRMQNSENK